MKGFKSKRGISLIVLVITIIVMIILAAAIILSISNSGIMDKANKAKTDSDTANLKEYANVLEAEWELGTKEISKEAYVNSKLEEKGYTGALLTEDGTLYTNLKANAKEVLKAGIKIGDAVTGYTLASSKTSYTTSGNENTAPDGNENNPAEQEVILNTEITWKYMGISDNGNIELISDYSNLDSQKLKLTGKGGFINAEEVLNNICKELYSTDNGTARCMNLNDAEKILGYVGRKGICLVEGYSEYDLYEFKTIKEVEKELGTITYRETPDDKVAFEDYIVNWYIFSKTSKKVMKYPENISMVFPDRDDCEYWLATAAVTLIYPQNEAYYYICGVSSSYFGGQPMLTSKGTTWNSDIYARSVRPIVEINADVSVSYGNGILTLN